MIINNKEIKSFVLYNEKGEDFLDQLPSYFDAYSKWQMSLTGVTKDHLNEVSTQIAEIEIWNNQLKDIEETIESQPLEEQVALLQKRQEIQDKLNARSISLAKEQAVLEVAFGYSETQRQKIKDYKDSLKLTREELLTTIAEGLTLEDKETPIFTLNELKKEPVGLLEELIYLVAKEPYNGIPTNFLSQLEARLIKKPA